MQSLKRLLILAPLGVFPSRSGGNFAIAEPARILARTGMKVNLFGFGIRRFEAFRHFKSFVRQIEPNLTEYRHVSIYNWIDYLQRRRTGPPLNAAAFLKKWNPKRLEKYYRSADVVQYELPWLFPYSPIKKPCIFVAHNVEASLIEQKKNIKKKIIDKAKSMEENAWQNADLVICFTEEDRYELCRRYGNRNAFIIPIGVNTSTIRPPSVSERTSARGKLGVKNRFVVLFTGSWHLPNLQALQHMQTLANSLKNPDLLFVAAGSVGDKPKTDKYLWITGPVAELKTWFHAADCCLNPITEGSGMNVKILDYFASGIPTITTPCGARGFRIHDGTEALIRKSDDFAETINQLKADTTLREKLSSACRDYVEKNHSWSIIGQRRLQLVESIL